jgi:hypothetical protein
MDTHAQFTRSRGHWQIVLGTFWRMRAGLPERIRGSPEDCWTAVLAAPVNRPRLADATLAYRDVRDEEEYAVCALP